MADYPVIDGYLGLLRSRVRWRDDVDDLVTEVEDHLYSTVERLEARGIDRDQAQRETLERFGDPELVAFAFATTARGGLAVPTESTKRAGTLSMLSAVLWPLVVGSWWIGGVLEPWGSVDRNVTAVFWVIGWAAVLSLAFLMSNIALMLNQRHGGFGLIGRAGLVFVGLGALGTIFAWVFVGWGLLLAIGTLLVGIAMLDRDIAPRIPTLAFAGGFAAGAVAWVALRVADRTLYRWSELYGGTLYHWSELYGQFWIVNMTGLTVGAIIFAIGLLGIGRWLREEIPADIVEPDHILTA